MPNRRHDMASKKHKVNNPTNKRIEGFAAMGKKPASRKRSRKRVGGK